MGLFNQFKADIRQAVASRKLAKQVQQFTANIADRQKLAIEVCRSLGIKHPEKSGVLLEDIVYRCRISTALCGAWDSARVIAQRLGWEEHEVRTERDKLRDAGAISTTNGRPVVAGKKVGRTHLHYRLTDVFKQALMAVSQLFKKILKRYTRRKSSNVVATAKPTKTRPLARAFVELENLEKRAEKRVNRDVGPARSTIDGIKSLLNRTKVRCV